MYASTEGTKEGKMIDFYQHLPETLDSIKELTKFIIIMEDWNARNGNNF